MLAINRLLCYTGNITKGRYDISNLSNDRLIEKAAEIAEEYEGTPLADALRINVERNNLEIVAELVRQTEQQRMSEAFDDKN